MFGKDEAAIGGGGLIFWVVSGMVTVLDEGCFAWILVTF